MNKSKTAGQPSKQQYGGIPAPSQPPTKASSLTDQEMSELTPSVRNTMLYQRISNKFEKLHEEAKTECKILQGWKDNAQAKFINCEGLSRGKTEMAIGTRGRQGAGAARALPRGHEQPDAEVLGGGAARRLTM